MRKVMLVGLLCLAVCGCATTPTEREADVVAVYVETVEFLVSLRTQGKIGDEDWSRVKDAIRVAQAARRNLKDAREKGENPATIQRLLDTAIRAMQAVVAARGEVTP